MNKIKTKPVKMNDRNFMKSIMFHKKDKPREFVYKNALNLYTKKTGEQKRTLHLPEVNK